MKNRLFVIIFIFSLVVLGGFSCTNSGGNLGVYKSEDGNNSWQAKNSIDDKKTINKIGVLDIKIDSTDPNVIYIGTKENGLYKSTDGSNSWQQTSLRNGTIFSIDTNPKDTKVIYIAGYFGTLGKIYKSNDGGENFEEVYSETHEKNPVLALAVDGYDPRKVYAGTKNGTLLKSEDSGRSWILQEELDNDILQIAINPHDTRHVIVGTESGGLFKTENGGKEWKEINEPLKEFDKSRNIRAVIFDPKIPGRVYLGSLFGLLVSKDEAKSWSEISILTELKRSSSLNLAIDDTDSPSLYLSIDSTVYKKSEQDQGWEVNKMTTGIIKSLAIDPNNNQIIYVGIGTNEDDY